MSYSRRTPWAEPAGATAERILSVLKITQRPLRLEELTGALALRQREGRRVCRWLTEEGYVVSTPGVAIVDSAEVPCLAWSLADKGRLWTSRAGALVIPEKP